MIEVPFFVRNCISPINENSSLEIVPNRCLKCFLRPSINTNEHMNAKGSVLEYCSNWFDFALLDILKLTHFSSFRFTH